MNENKTNINWFPGHMQKTKRLIKEKIDLIDVVYEVIDARIPYSSKIKDIDELIKNKPRILIMTKKDLCDIDKTLLWKEYYEKQGYHVLVVDLNNNDDYKKIIDVTNEVTKELKAKWESKGLISKDVKALVVGIPNVGKSTLINKLANKKVANVGNRPGVTTSVNWLKTNYNILLLDTPGILWPKFDEEKVALNLACTGAIKSEILNADEIAVYVLEYLNNYYPGILKERYSIDTFSDVLEAYDVIGKKIGAFKNGEVEYEKVSLKVLNDIKNEYIKGVTFDDIG